MAKSPKFGKGGKPSKPGKPGAVKAAAPGGKPNLFKGTKK